MNAKIQEIVPLILPIKYSYPHDINYDYSKSPRPCHNFVFMLDGNAIINSNGNFINLSPKEILFIPKNTTYTAEWKATPKVKFVSLHFFFSPLLDPFETEIIQVQKIPINNFDELLSLIKEIENLQFSREADSFFTLSSFYKLCGHLLPNIQVDANEKYSKTILPAITYIKHNFNKQITVEQLSSLCYVSPSRFFYLFKKQTGLSPISYKNKFAIQCVAQSLLAHPEKNIADVATSNGFTNLIYFGRLFKKIIGKTPSQYRKEECLKEKCN